MRKITKAHARNSVPSVLRQAMAHTPAASVGGWVLAHVAPRVRHVMAMIAQELGADPGLSPQQLQALTHELRSQFKTMSSYAE